MVEKEAKVVIIIQKNIFIMAGVLTICVFITGIFTGIWLDNLRGQDIRSRLTEIETNWNDARLQSLFFQSSANSIGFCDSAIKSNLEFADKIYKEGLKIERYENINRFDPSLILEKKRYVLLQIQFLLNALSLKEKCDTNYSTLVYFYYHYNDEIANKQKLQSAVNLDLKEKCGDNLLMISLPIDLDIMTVNLIKDKYKITKIPSVLINNEILLEGLQTKADLERYMKC